jgi:hypothetical protein
LLLASAAELSPDEVRLQLKTGAAGLTHPPPRVTLDNARPNPWRDPPGARVDAERAPSRGAPRTVCRDPAMTIVDALSVAAGEYVSVSTQRVSERADQRPKNTSCGRIRRVS